MKNIHVLPTDKPSRLWFHKLNRNLGFSDLPMEYNGSGTWVEGRNIYITNDEEIKEGDWFIYKNEIIHRDKGKIDSMWVDAVKNGKKIILTTDQDLIKDGIQAIDDEFLEWFVKNPSCEWVDVKYQYWKEINDVGKYTYKIIIPQEEPKMIECYFIPTNNTSSATICGNCGKEKFLHTIGSGILTKEEPKQETLEETAERLATNRHSRSTSSWYLYKNGIIEGAKWQQERMYAEADNIMRFLNTEVELKLSDTKTIKRIKWYFETYFEQFKKKQ
jgi:hypothetical protein